MDPKRLEQGLESGNLREASLVISEASQHKDEEIVVLLIKHLRVTENKLLRNEIAIALSDIGNQLAVDPIIELLKDPKTLESRGSLLYALRSFDLSSRLELLVDFLINGSYEVRHESKNLLSLVEGPIPEDLILKIKRAIDDLQDRIEVLSDTLDQFANGK